MLKSKFCGVGVACIWTALYTCRGLSARCSAIAILNGLTDSVGAKSMIVANLAKWTRIRELRNIRFRQDRFIGHTMGPPADRKFEVDG